MPTPRAKKVKCRVCNDMKYTYSFTLCQIKKIKCQHCMNKKGN